MINSIISSGSLLPVAYETILKQLSANQFSILAFIEKHRELRSNYPFNDLEYDREELDHLESLRLIKEEVEIEVDESGQFGNSNRLVGRNKLEGVYRLTELGRRIQAMNA